MESKEKETQGKYGIVGLLTIIGLCFTLYKVYTRVNDYYNKKDRNEEYRINKIENHKKWVDKMTYHCDNLSEHHYITADHLSEDSNSVFHSNLKVVDVNDSEVKLVGYRVKGYTPVARLMEESYIRDAYKDTITLSIDKLKKTIFKNQEIKDNTYKYQDSLKQEGLFYLITDIAYIDGPAVSGKSQFISKSYGGDTISFRFKNFNKKSLLTKITNVSGDFKWLDSLPKDINGFQLNSSNYNKNAFFDLKAINPGLKTGFEFKLQFEDSFKKKHIFLVTKDEKSTLNRYECKRVLN